MHKILIGFFIFLFSNSSFGQLTNFTLQVNATNETCAGNGVLSFAVTNTTPGATIVYNIYRLPDVTTPITVTSASSFTGLTAGNYRVIATQSLGVQSNSQQQDVPILNRINPLQYNLTYQNVLCGNDGKIIVNVTQGNPVNYEIISGPMIRPLQTSNIFSGLTIGTYQVRVFDSCGDGIVSDITLAQPSRSNLSISGVSENNLTCNTVDLVIGITSGTTDLQNIIAYPLIIECTVYPPSGPSIVLTQNYASGNSLSETLQLQIPFFYNQSYTYDLKITDSCGNIYHQNNNVINTHLSLAVSEIMDACVKKLVISPANFVAPFTVNFLSAPVGFNPIVYNNNHPGPFTGAQEYFNLTTPYPDGNYSVQITDACGRTAIGNYTTQQIPLDFSVLEINDACDQKLQIQTGANINFTVEFLSAPAGFNPIMFNSLHPGPFLGHAEYYNPSIPYPQGTYIVKITDECGRTATRTLITNPFTSPPLNKFVLPGCGLREGSLLMSGTQFFQNVTITAAPSGFGHVLPYDVSQNIKTDAHFFSMNSLPTGTYTFSSIDICNRPRTDTVVINGYQIYSNEVTVTQHCSSFDVFLNFDSNLFSSNLWLQKFNPQNNTWGHPQTGNSNGVTLNTLNAILLSNHTNNVNINFMGRFRVVNTFSVFGNGENPNVECQNVLSEFEYTSGPKIRNLYSYSCSNNLFDVIVDATGAAPLQYRITTRNGQPFVINNATSSNFTGLQPGIYNFQIEDACGNILNRIYDISSPVSFQITADNLCDGQTGSLNVPYFSFLHYEWWKDNNTATILSTSNVLSLSNFNMATDSGVYHVRITNPGNPNSCMNNVQDFTVSNQLNSPRAGTGSIVNLCGSQGTINLFSFLTGTYDAFGTWTETSSSGMLINHLWNASGIVSGIYTFKYRVNGLCGNNAEATVQIEINPIPQNPVASGDNSVCEGDSLHLFASTIPGVIYQWTGPNGFNSNDQNPVLGAVTISNQGTYTVSVVQNGCVSATDSVDVVVNKLPYFTVKDNCQNNLTYLTATVLDSAINLDSLIFTWTYPDGTVQNANPINVTGSVTGLYTLTITSASGCSVVNTFPLTCTNCGIPKGISPNGDGLNDNFDLSCLSGIVNVKIFNRYGVNVYELDNYVDQWDGKDYKGHLLPTATYYYVVKFDTGDVKTGWVYLNY